MVWNTYRRRPGRLAHRPRAGRCDLARNMIAVLAAGAGLLLGACSIPLGNGVVGAILSGDPRRPEPTLLARAGTAGAAVSVRPDGALGSVMDRRRASSQAPAAPGAAPPGGATLTTRSGRSVSHRYRRRIRRSRFTDAAPRALLAVAFVALLPT